MPDKKYQTLIDTSELPNDGMHRLYYREFDVLICAVRGDYHVFENRCSHQGQPLHQGRIRDGCLVCPYHAARFFLESGQPMGVPATVAIRKFPSHVRDGSLEVDFG
jgi:3-phenylpropionate/trans-cinnamate dioxygenase ferredoxin subunit